MKLSNQRARLAGLSTLALLVALAGCTAAPPEAQPQAAVVQRSFASPDEAVKALQTAVESQDRAALREVYGTGIDELVTGDKVQDANNSKRFAALMAQGCVQAKEGDDKIILEVGRTPGRCRFRW